MRNTSTPASHAEANNNPTHSNKNSNNSNNYREKLLAKAKVDCRPYINMYDMHGKHTPPQLMRSLCWSIVNITLNDSNRGLEEETSEIINDLWLLFQMSYEASQLTHPEDK